LTGRADAPEPAASQARLLLAEWLFEGGDHAGAADCARAALASASQRGEPGVWMQACELLGSLLLAGASPASALPFFQELERLAGLTGASRQRIVALKGRGDALGWVDGKRAEAIRVLRDAVAAAERAGDSGLHQSALGSLVNLLRDEPGGIVEASSLVIERLALVKKTSDSAAEAQVLFQYGRICQDRGEPDRAHPMFHQSLILAHRTGQPALARECERAIGDLQA
jgi:tetratricopeptide (TPR) repeat protein